MYRRNKQARLLTGGLIGALPVTTPGDEYWNDVTLLLDGTSLTDQSIAGNNVSNAGGVSINQTTTGTGFDVEPKVYDINSSGNQYLYAADGSMDDLGDGAFTIEALVKVANTSTARGIFTTIRPEDTSPNHLSGVGLWVNGSGLLRATVNGADNSYAEHSGTTEDGNWHHVALVYDGTEYEVYLDGTASGSPVTATPVITSNSKVQIGKLYTNYNLFGLDGSVTQVRITQGVARYTANFTPPTASFLTNAPVVGRRGVGTYDAVDTVATFDPDFSTSVARTLSQGNLWLTSDLSNFSPTGSTQPMSSGKYYAEFLAGDSDLRNAFGVCEGDYNFGSGDRSYTGSLNNVGMFATDGRIFANGTQQAAPSFSGVTHNSTVVGVALDLDSATKTVKWYLDGTLHHTYTLTSPSSMRFCVGDISGSYTAIFKANFGQDHTFASTKTALATPYTDANGLGEFYYQPPAGFTGLYTTIPTTLRTRGYIGAAPVGRSIYPEEHFKAVTYTGAGGTPSITGVGFQPDFVWIKNRDQTDTHVITDVVRGVGKTLTSETTAAEVTDTDTVTSFDADGFSLGADVKVNTNTEDYVAWCLKAGGTGVSNTDGSITSTVSANVDAGFSVATYTGTGAVATVGHGLTNAPELILGKRTSGTTANWFVGGSILGTTETLYLNLSNVIDTYTGDTIRNEVTSTTFRLGTDTNRNKSSETHVAYCFHSVSGFSKIGSYTGNNSSTGPHVSCGFQPAFVMVKAVDSVGDWIIFDNARSPSNSRNKLLYANLNSAEQDGVTDKTPDVEVDFDSDGFTPLWTNDDLNAAESYVYLAFAESNTFGTGMLTLYDRYIDTLA